MEKMKERELRVEKAISHQIPDRVPFVPILGNVYCLEYGVTVKSAMEDIRNLKPGIDPLLQEMNPDLLYTPDFFPIEAMKRLDAIHTSWPGKQPEFGDNFTYQVSDAVYLEDESYEDFLKDPSIFLQQKVMAEKYGQLGGLRIPTNYELSGNTVMGFAAFGIPAVRQAYEAMLDAGEIVMNYMQGMQELDQYFISKGYPIFGNAIVNSPFDDFADNVRGLINTVMDLKTDPELLKEAVDRFADVTIPSGVARAKMIHAKYVFIPLHAGVDEFMSPDDYENYYWPSLYRMICEYIKIGVTPMLFCEGNYKTRLDILSQLEPGKVVCFFEKQDMALAKKKLEKRVCIAGNMDNNLLMSGTREEVVEGTKRLLDVCAPGGGYLMSNAISLDNCKRENLITWRETVELEGKY